MVSWIFLVLFSITLGGLVSLIKYRFGWLIIILAPMIIIYFLNYYYSGLPQDGAAMENAAYIFVGGPSIIMAFLSYFLIKHFRNKKI